MLQEHIRNAQIELECATNRFNNAFTEDEIDLAIIDIIAAETKLNELLKLKKEG